MSFTLIRKTILLSGLCLSMTALFASAKSPRKAQKISNQTTEQASTPAALTADSTQSFSQQSLTSFIHFYERGIQEKLYLKTDKPYYSAGEKLWFRGWLVNASTHTPALYSRFIYAELINDRDSLICRARIRDDSGAFHNCLELPPTLPAGDYTLRAYTRWMRNEGNDFFFSCPIRIENPLDDAVTTTPSYLLNDDKTVTMNISFRNSIQQPLVGKKVQYTLYTGARRRKATATTNDNGYVALNFTPAPDSLGNSVELRIDDEITQFRQMLTMPCFSQEFDIQFFPEGGALLAGEVQSIAFKAIGTNGRGVEVKGTIFGNDQPVCDFESIHKGMGQIGFTVEPGVHYYAQVTSAQGVTRQVDLPETEEVGCRLRVTQNAKQLFYQTTPIGIDRERLCAVIHSRGRIVAVNELSGSSSVRFISKSELYPGITHICIVDKPTRAIVAQRLVFLRDTEPLKATFTPDKTNYDQRERVDLDILVTDAEGNPVAGDFALSVTDSQVVRPDSTRNNLQSWMLLDSDLKGYIEDPGWYFLHDDYLTDSKLDLLMMTQGWARFDISSVLKDAYGPCQYLPETTQSVSGQVKGFFGGAARKPKLIIYNSKTHALDMADLGDTNRFTISNLDIQDSTTLIIQALNRLGGTGSIEIEIDRDTFPAPQRIPIRKNWQDLASTTPETFIDRSKMRYYYEGGMRVFNIESVVVKAPVEAKQYTSYGVTPTRTLEGEALERYNHSNIYTAISMLPGVRASNSGSISIRGSQYPPAIILDDMPISLEELDMIPMQDIDGIALFSGPEAAIFGLGAAGGVIAIRTKTGDSTPRSSAPSPSIAKLSDIGYKQPKAFYQPKYEIDSILNNQTPDMRSTIAWEPVVRTDSTGHAHVSFYTADYQTPYDLSLEGMTSDGRICTTLQRWNHATRKEE